MEERGYITKDSILKYVSEEEIFGLVFGFIPEEGEYVTSPFRLDKRPGCWFEYAPNGKLIFKDFGNSTTWRGIRLSHLDCFGAVQYYYQLPNFYKTLEFIKNVMIDNAEVVLKPRRVHSVIERRPMKGVKIHIEPRPFQEVDRQFWEPYGITSSNLIEDDVYAIGRYQLLNTKKGNIRKEVITPCYSYSGFEEGRKKLYFPYRKKKRFITNCTPNDIGEIESLPLFGDQLILSKSYKDCRVLRNQGITSVWLQNEGSVPGEEIITTLSERFTNIIVFFDNDYAGITASIKIRDIINSFYPQKARNLYLPEILLNKNITDPADMYSTLGKKNLLQFLKFNFII